MSSVCTENAGIYMSSMYYNYFQWFKSFFLRIEFIQSNSRKLIRVNNSNNNLFNYNIIIFFPIYSYTLLDFKIISLQHNCGRQWDYIGKSTFQQHYMVDLVSNLCFKWKQRKNGRFFSRLYVHIPNSFITQIFKWKYYKNCSENLINRNCAFCCCLFHFEKSVMETN